MKRDTELLLRIACMYYIQSETMEAIAHHMGVSRLTVSRLLKRARDRGLVCVTTTDPDHSVTRLVEIFRKNFHVQIHLVNVRPGSSYMLWFEQIMKVAARLLGEIVIDNNAVGMAWGVAVFAIAQHLRPRDLNKVIVVSLNGGVNHHVTGLLYVGSILQRLATAFYGEEQFLALPAFFGNPGTRTAMWVERSTRHMLQVWASCTKAISGVGGFGANLQSHVYSVNYLDNSKLAYLKSEDVVGDACTVIPRVDGSWCDLPINSRITDTTSAELRAIPRRICVVSRTGKAVSVLGALRAGVVTDLVISEETVHTVLREMRPGLRFDQILRTADSRLWLGCTP